MKLPDFVMIPAGEFLMGENEQDKFAGDTERPRHRVKIAPFQLAKSPVTLEEYRHFRPGHEADLPETWPACMVSWEEATAYCDWLGGGCRLPSEAEWEYAARAGSRTHYPWGDLISPAEANYYYTEQGVKVGCGHRTPPGTFPPNAFGLFDMPGNVCEWMADTWHPDYQGAPATGGPWITEEAGDRRVLRGGAWDYLPRLLRVSWRDALPASSRRDNVGFRIARPLNITAQPS
jgi:formylglycine-generating enzyme required for sulfatase activity